MKTIITISILTLFCSCMNTVEKEVQFETESSVDESGGYRKVERDYLDSLLKDICTTEHIEFTDFYKVLDSISSDEFENLILVDSLKSKDFEVTNWGRGNWMKGPRIVTFTMTRGQCECHVDKLYYSMKEEGKYKVTERIKCSEQ